MLKFVLIFNLGGLIGLGLGFGTSIRETRYSNQKLQACQDQAKNMGYALDYTASVCRLPR